MGITFLRKQLVITTPKLAIQKQWYLTTYNKFMNMSHNKENQRHVIF